jgi:diguanylate cyclase (GGDEF)-like protein
MSVLDATTLLLVSSVVISISGVTFILATVLRRNDLVGRLWSIFYVGAIFSVFAMIVGDAAEQTWWAFGAGSGFFVAALGLVWAGARAANRRQPLIAILIAIAAGVLVVVLRLVAGPSGASAHGSVEMYVGAAVFFGLAGVESSRGSLGKLSGGRVLAVLLGLAGLYYLVRAVSLVVLGGSDPTFQLFFGESTASLFEIGLAVIGTLGLMSIQDDRFRQASVAEAEFGARVAIDGILVRETFQELAETWLMRSIRERTTLALVVIEVADLSEVNVAFGRAAGDSALRTVGRLVLMHAPTSSLLGHISPRRFAILMELPTQDSVDAIIDRIADAVLGTPIDDQDRFRASIFSGSATTRASGARYQDLLRDAKAHVFEDRDAARDRAEAARTGGVLTRN